MKRTRMFVVLFFIFSFFIGSSALVSTANASSWLQNFESLEHPTHDFLFGSWFGFFRDYRKGDDTFDTSLVFRTGTDGSVLALYEFGDGSRVRGAATGNFDEAGSLVLKDLGQRNGETYTYHFRVFDDHALVGKISLPSGEEVGYFYFERVQK